MKVVIVGAGIAGLTLAHELLRRGIDDVKILESAQEILPVGAGIHIGSWGMSVFDANGTGAALRSRGEPYLLRRYLDRCGEVIGVVNLADIARRHGGITGVFLHRADLQAGLQEGLPPSMVVTGARACDIEVLGHTVTVGTEGHGGFSADVLVGCDGLHSVIREAVFGSPPHALGKRVVRTVIDYQGGLDAFEVYRGIDASVGITPISGGRTYLWFNHSAWPGDPDTVRDGGAEGLRAAMADFTAPRIRELLARIQERPTQPGHSSPSGLIVSDLLEVTVDPWYRGPVVLCGDAAHAMLPSTGSGATMAAEDAYVLARELARVKAGTASLDVALDAYYGERLPRVEGMRARTRLASHQNNLPTEALCRMRDDMDRLAMQDRDYHAFEVTDALDASA